MAEGHEIVARFQSLHAYDARGFTVDSGLAVHLDGSAHGVDYNMAVGDNINGLCRLLLDDDFTDDEGAWAAEHKCSPPYVLLHIGPTSEHKCSGGFAKTEGDETWVYDGFREAREELKSLHAGLLPALETALSCSADSKGRNTRFQPVETTVFGLTPAGDTIRDIRLQMHAEGYASVRVARDWIEAFLSRTADLAADISPRVARQFQLGLRDTDHLKRFLFYFLAIEIETHRVYSSIDHDAALGAMVEVPSRVRDDGMRLLVAHPAGLKGLPDRFVWCAICAWPTISEADVHDFRELKKIRDRIAHGGLSAPPAAAVASAEQLAKKLLSDRFGA
jgi:hypothetical protein